MVNPMALKIRSKLPSTGSSFLWTTEWQLMMEMHIAHMQRYGLIDYINIEPAKAYKYEGDLWGLLFEERIPFELHWVIMRLNAMRNPSDYTQEHTALIVPASDTVSRYNAKFADSYKKKR